jgi:hypothetical protein
VPTAPYGGEEPVIAGKVHRMNDVSGGAAASDDGGFPVEHPIPNEPRAVVALVARLQQFTPEVRAQPLHRRIKSLSGWRARDGQLVCHVLLQ